MIKKIAKGFATKDNQNQSQQDGKELRKNSATKVSDDVFKILRYYENFKAKAYYDAVGVLTIGYGDTGPHVKLGQVIGIEEAERRMAERVKREFLPDVLSVLRVNPNQKQLDAMVSLAYNIGITAFKNSTLVKVFNTGDMESTAKQFLRWIYAKGKIYRGLQRRRRTEMELFLGASVDDAIRIGVASV